MKMRSTKGALLMSALSLFLCFTMLMGTTFAWFTDSAASNGNIITAGTLDVEMYWADGTEAVPTTDSGWTDASTGAIFKYTLWEPGYAEVRHIKIANEGNLALKYKVLIQANGTVSDLSDVIDVYYADPAVQVADASALTADNKLGTLTDVLANLGLTGNGTLKAGKSDVITLALKMQEGAGNEYMGKSIGTDFSIILVATQLNYEPDSFGPDYDADATYPVLSMPVTLPAAGATVVAATLTTDKENPANGVSVTLPAATMEKIVDIAATDNVTAVAIAHTEPKVDTSAKSVSFDSIDVVDQTGKVIDLATIGNTEPITVTVPVGDAFAEGTVVVIYHDDEPVASAVVTNKTVTYTTTHFCRVDVNLGDGNVDSAAELAAAIANGGTIELNADMTLDSTLVVPAGVTVLLDMNGHKLTATDKNAIRNDGGNLTIVDGTFERTGTAVGYAVNQASGTMVLDGVTVIGGLYTSGTSLIVNDSDISHHQSTRHAIYAYNTAVTLNSGNFYNYNAGNATIMAAGNATVEINGGTYGIADGRATFGWTSCLLDMNGTATMTLNDGTFNGGFRVNSANAKLTINGGSFNDCYGSNYNIYSGKVEVKGGTYTDAAAKNFAEKYVADDCKLVDNGDGTWTVKSTIAKVSTPEELKEAMESDLYKGAVLTADIALPLGFRTTVLKGTEKFLDMNGHTMDIVCKEGVIGVVGTLTVKNGTVNTACTTNGLAGAFSVNGTATLTLEGVTLNVGNTDAVVASAGIVMCGGTLNLNKGTVINVTSIHEGYGVYVMVGTNVVNLDGGKIVLNAPADVEAYGIVGQCDYTVDANAGEIVVDASEKHYGVYAYEGWGNVTLNATTDFTFTVAEGGNAYNAAVVADLPVRVETVKDLQSALAAGETVVMGNDITVSSGEAFTAPYGNKTAVSQNGGLLDGKGNTLGFSMGGDHYVLMTSGGTIKNLYINDGFRGIAIMDATETIYLDNVHVGGASVGYALNTMEGNSTQDLIVKNSSFYGWNSWALLKSASFENCTFGQGTYWGATSIYGRIARPYVDTVFTNCEFNAEGYILDISQLDGTVDLVNCTLNGVAITAENFADLVDLTDLTSGGASLMAKVMVNGVLVFDEANQ